jgi:hypothetical protein
VNDWAVIWLGVIAVSTGVMALTQIGLIVVSLRVARQLSETANDIRREIRPLVDKVNGIADKVGRIADEAGRATALATTQIERIDEILTTATARVDEGLNIVRHAMGGPLRQGYAIALAIRAAIAAFSRRANRAADHTPAGATRDEEDALFVG